MLRRKVGLIWRIALDNDSDLPTNICLKWHKSLRLYQLQSEIKSNTWGMFFYDFPRWSCVCAASSTVAAHSAYLLWLKLLRKHFFLFVFSCWVILGHYLLEGVDRNANNLTLFIGPLCSLCLNMLFLSLVKQSDSAQRCLLELFCCAHDKSASATALLSETKTTTEKNLISMKTFCTWRWDLCHSGLYFILSYIVHIVFSL